MPSLLATLGLNISPFEAGLRKGKRTAEREGEEMIAVFGRKIGEGLANFTVPEKGIKTGIEMIRKAFEENAQIAQEAKEISVGADRLGVGIERFQDLARAAREAGTDINGIFAAYKSLAKASIEAEAGSAKQIAAFETLGVKVDELKGKSVDEIFQDIARNAAGAEMNVDRAGAAMVLMGKHADQVLTGLQRGTFQLPNPFKEDEKTIRAREQYRNDLNFIADAWKRLKENIFSFGTGGPVQSFIHEQVNDLKFLLGMTRSLGGNDQRPTPAVDLKTVTKAEVKADSAEAKEFERLAMANAEHTLKLQDEIARKKREMALMDMTAAERVLELTAEAKDLEAKAQNAGNRDERLENELKLLDVQKELRNAKREADAEEKRQEKERMRADRFREPEVNQLQRIGGYVQDSPVAVSAANAAVKSEGHLAAIHAELVKQGKLLSRTKWG